MLKISHQAARFYFKIKAKAVISSQCFLLGRKPLHSTMFSGYVIKSGNVWSRSVRSNVARLFGNAFFVCIGYKLFERTVLENLVVSCQDIRPKMIQDLQFSCFFLVGKNCLISYFGKMSIVPISY